jgi:hypothetical protein
MTLKHPEEFHYHKLNDFGAGGLRFREANEIISKIVVDCPVLNGGIPYLQIKTFFDRSWKSCPGANLNFLPAYIQLDHVYGLTGYELNLAHRGESSVSMINVFSSGTDALSRNDPLTKLSMGSPLVTDTKCSHIGDASPSCISDLLILEASTLVSWFPLGAV